MFSIFLFLFLTILPFTFSLSSTNRPISLSPTTTLSFKHHPANASITFHLSVTTTVSSSSALWIGFGISEPTSGGLSGTDLFTVEWTTTSSSSRCALVDRYIPFIPYPFTKSSAKLPSIFPIADFCQNDSSWILNHCSRRNGIAKISVSRKLESHDTQDRSILPGSNSIVVGYGKDFSYTNGNWIYKKLVFFNDPKQQVKKSIGIDQLPIASDVDGELLIQSTGFKIGGGFTSCTTKTAVDTKDLKKMVVGFEPIIKSQKLRNGISRMMVYACSSNDTMPEITAECAVGKSVGAPLGSKHTGCSTVIAVYGRGSSRVMFPKEAGFLLQAPDADMLIMETEYDTEAALGVVDTAGIRLFTTTKMRSHEAGSLQIGDPLHILDGRLVEYNKDYEFSCPSGCTNQFNEEINLIASFAHMHKTGMQIYTNRFDSNGKFIEPLHTINFWSANHQPARLFVNKTISPGDQFQLTCRYDARKLPKTKFGAGSNDEGCSATLFYWPVQRAKSGDRISLCAYAETPDDGNSVTLCGDGSTEHVGQLVLLGENPTLKDTHDAPEVFGNKPSKCDEKVVKNVIDDNKQEQKEQKEQKEEKQEKQEEDDDVGRLPTESTEVDTTINTNDIIDKGPITPPTDNTDTTGNELALTPAPEPTDVEFSTPVPSSTERACFPSDALITVHTDTIIQKTMSNLQIGDMVHTGNGQYSRIILFTHQDKTQQWTFLRIELQSGNILEVSKDHYVYTNKGLILAKDVQNGMMMMIQNMYQKEMKMDQVITVEKIVKKGLFNPQTMNGNLMVNNIKVSCYTKAIVPNSAHGLLAPVRWYWWLMDMVSRR